MVRGPNQVQSGEAGEKIAGAEIARGLPAPKGLFKTILPQGEALPGTLIILFYLRPDEPDGLYPGDRNSICTWTGEDR